MYSITPHEESIIAQAAIKAPTGDNCQPFSLLFKGSYAEIYHSKALGEHALNHKNQGSIIALGAMIESIDIACSTLGIGFTADYLVDQNTDSSLWVTLQFSKEDRYEDGLYPFIFRRYTDRRRYKQADIDTNTLMEMTKHPTLSFGKFHYSEITKDITEFVMNSEEYVWETKEAYEDLFKWMRLSKGEVKNATDGMTVFDMGMNFMEVHFFKLLRRFPIVLKIMWSLGFKTAVRQRNKELLKSSSGVVVFTANSLDTKALILTGRRCFRFWLEATRIGLVMQPISTMAFVMSSAQFDPPKVMSHKFIQRFVTQVHRFRKVFQLDSEEHPVWAFRIGKPRINVDLSRSPRRSLTEFAVSMPVEEITPAVAESQKRLV